VWSGQALVEGGKDTSRRYFNLGPTGKTQFLGGLSSCSGFGGLVTTFCPRAKDRLNPLSAAVLWNPSLPGISVYNWTWISPQWLATWPVVTMDLQ
jgi:hypothetical protein